MNEHPQSSRHPGGRRYRWVVVILLGLLLILAALLVTNRVAARRARLLEAAIASEELEKAAAARQVAARFQQHLAGGSAGAFSLDGPALTMFIQQRYGSRIPDSVGPWRILLDSGQAQVEGVVDLKQYLRQLDLEQPGLLAEMVGDEIAFAVRGRFEADSGRGRFVIEEVRLLGLPLPLDLVERVGRSNGSRGSVLIQEFPLPGRLRSGRIEDNQLVLHGPDA